MARLINVGSGRALFRDGSPHRELDARGQLLNGMTADRLAGGGEAAPLEVSTASSMFRAWRGGSLAGRDVLEFLPLRSSELAVVAARLVRARGDVLVERAGGQPPGLPSLRSCCRQIRTAMAEAAVSPSRRRCRSWGPDCVENLLARPLGSEVPMMLAFVDAVEEARESRAAIRAAGNMVNICGSRSRPVVADCLRYSHFDIEYQCGRRRIEHRETTTNAAGPLHADGRDLADWDRSLLSVNPAIEPGPLSRYRSRWPASFNGRSFPIVRTKCDTKSTLVRPD